MNNKIAIFIDEGNVWSSYKSIGKLLKYDFFKDFFEKKFKGEVYAIFFYKAYPADGTREYSIDPQHKFMTYLKKGLGFRVRKKSLKTIILRDKGGNIIYEQKTGKPATIEKGNFDVEIAIDAVRFAGKYQTVLF